MRPDAASATVRPSLSLQVSSSSTTSIQSVAASPTSSTTLYYTPEDPAKVAAARLEDVSKKVDDGSVKNENSVPVSTGCTPRDWATLIGGFLSIAATGGCNNAIGLLQRYWENHQLVDYTSRDIGWIAGTSICLSLFFPVLAGPVFDRYGHFWLLIVGTALFSSGLLAMSFIEKETMPMEGLVFGLLFLTWGILSGIGTGLISTAVSGVVCRRFDRRRGLACGIVSGGNSVGGVVWPMMLRDTLDRWGWKWAIKTAGCIALVLLIAGCVLIKAPVPVINEHGEEKGTTQKLEKTRVRMKKGARKAAVKKCFMEGLKCFTTYTFCFMTASLAVSQFIIMGVVGTLPRWGESQGFDKSLIFNFVAVMNAASGFGRVAVGAVSDWLGRFNSMVLTQCLAIAVVFGLFLNVGDDIWRFYIFASFWGFSYGAILSMMSVLVREQCNPEQFGTYLSASHSVISIGGFLCIPLSAQMLTSFGPRIHVIFFGAMCVLSAALMIVSRWAFLSFTWKWAVKV